MVQVIQPRDIAGEIGQALGGGLGKAADIGAQRMLVGGALQEALAGAEGGDQSPFDTLLGLSKAFAGVPGGQQLIGDLFPVLRKEMVRSAKGGDGGGGGQPSRRFDQDGAPEPRAQSAADRVKELTQENIDAKMDYDEALSAAQSQLALETAEQSKELTRVSAARQFFNQNFDESFGKDLDPALRPSMRARFERSVGAGESPDKAFEPLRKEYRAAQVEIEKLGKIAGRDLFSPALATPEDAMNQARGVIPKLIEIDPELARSMVEQQLDFGEGEASLIVRPGSDSYKKFTSKMQKNFSPEVLKSNEPVGKQIQQISKRQKEKLEKFLRNKFDPRKDSLLALRHDMFTAGIRDKEFLDTFNKVFPDGANDKRLSEFNRNEVPRLSQPAEPGLGEIFRGLFQGQLAPAKRAAAINVRGKR